VVNARFCGETAVTAVSIPQTSARSGYDIKTIQELLGRKETFPTMIYIVVLNRGGQGLQKVMIVEMFQVCIMSATQQFKQSV
jgi:hypothetical protein